MRHFFKTLLRSNSKRQPKNSQRQHRPLTLEAMEERSCPSSFGVIGATGSPTQVLSVKIVNEAGATVDTVTPFNNLTSIRVATGDFDGDGRDDEFAVLGRRSGIDERAEVVTYSLDANGKVTSETGRFFAFEAGILGNGFIATGDFDGDGDDDIAVSQIGGGRNTVTLQLHQNNDVCHFPKCLPL